MTKKNSTALKTYIKELRTHHASGQATEHTYRPALENYIRSFGSAIAVTNEPGQRGSGSKNKPDFVVMKGSTPLGYIETKDVDVDLDEVADSNQIKRYCDAYPNLIVTDYLEFRRYVKGELRSSVKLGRTNRSGITIVPDAEPELFNFFQEFLLEEAFSISNSTELAARLAALTRQVKKIVRKELEIEEDSARLHKLMVAFQKVLIADLDESKFADMFAQTLAYGFFAARVHFDGKGEFSRRTASSILPRTNPFLRRLFAEFANESLPDSLIGAVDEIVELLKKTDIKAVLENFGEQGKEDPVVHFYESFLGEYDPKLKKEMGVFYTPDAVVAYMIKSVDEILQTHFKKRKGLADDKALVLDPALGTGSFLHKIVDHIHAKTQKGTWDSYVSENLLERIFGFEILMAPYSVAHLNLGMQLQSTGYKFEKDQRLGVYLTNTLEETAKRSEVLFSDWISDEAEAAAAIKRDKPVMVVVGNPPYSAISHNNGEWINGLMRGFDSLSSRKVANYFECEGKPLGEKKLWLNDDYVKFIRFAQWRIEHSGTGILAFITNHGFLDNPTFRGMREALMEDFDDIYIIDLHGNSKKQEQSPDGSKDENVFNIQQGVSICFMLRTDPSKQRKLGAVHRFDLHGSRESKFEWLNKNSWQSTKFKKLDVRTPDYTFKKIDRSLDGEYKAGYSLKDLFPKNTTGFVTACDSMSIQFSETEMWNTVRDLVQDDISKSIEKWKLGGNRDWQPSWARDDVKKSGPKRSLVTKLQYRPFDYRWTYYTGNMKGFMCNPRQDLMTHLKDGDNIALISVRQVAERKFNHALVTDCIVDNRVTFSSKGTGYVFPLRIAGNYNVNAELFAQIEEQMGYPVEPEDAFNYVYAVLYSTSYRERYIEFLQMDYARIQFPPDKKTFKAISKLGSELVELHLMKSTKLEGSKVIFSVKGNNQVQSVKYEAKTGRVFINKSQYFENVPPAAWSAELGGYQVLEKWLKGRKDRELSHEDVEHFERMVEMILRTEDVMARIDQAITQAGGWPFVSTVATKKKA